LHENGYDDEMKGTATMLLITGATGYIGRQLVARLVAQGERPRCLVRNRERASALLPLDKIDLVQGETSKPETLEEAVRGVDTIVHAAFMTADLKQSAGNHYEETNVFGTLNLVRAAEGAGVKRIIEVSGLGTKPDRRGTYMQGRFLAEKIVMESRLDWTIIRPSVLFGGESSFVKGMANLLRTAPVAPLIGGGKTLFQPIYVEDVVTIILKILAEPEERSHKIYTIGGPEYYSLKQIFDILLGALAIKRPEIPVPVPLVILGAIAMELVLPKPPVTRAAMTLFSFDNVTDKESVERDFGFTPTSFTRYIAEHGV
jgi:uncharacterized protein YbjT (DUF2867 family)